MYYEFIRNSRKKILLEYVNFQLFFFLEIVHGGGC